MYSGELNVYPVTLIKERPRSDMECGGKIVLPPSVLEALTSRNNQLTGPMIFKLTSTKTNASTHCGVLEFIAEEGIINVPSWVLDLLQLEINDKVQVSSISLPTAHYVRFQPQCSEFLDIANPKAVLENHLREFSCLTENDVIPIFYNNRLYKLKFQNDGYLVIENFLTPEEVTTLRKLGQDLTENIPADEKKATFNTTEFPQNKDKYFLESGDKIRYFFEEGALDDKGELLVPANVSLNKVGHALHWLHPQFKDITFSKKVQDLCRCLRLDDPVVLQSMYIYKNPRIGSEVSPHQDSTFLFTEPNTLVGFWFPLDDATPENGCLSFIPGSHQSGAHRRFVRNPNPSDKDGLLIFDRPSVLYPSSGFIPTPTPKGSCVVIHGDVVHKSEPNKSDKSRHAYTFHVMDVSSKYSPENWLQSPLGFPLLYSDYD